MASPAVFLNAYSPLHQQEELCSLFPSLLGRAVGLKPTGGERDLQQQGCREGTMSSVLRVAQALGCGDH